MDRAGLGKEISMANEIQADYSSGNTIYAVIRNVFGEVWYITGEVFETWGTDSRDANDYDISLIDKGGSKYIGDFDSNIPAGRYCVQIFLQAGAGPDDGDSMIGSSEIFWSGSGRITADKLLANKAEQDKTNGQIKYYDDDGQTVLVTMDAVDTAANVARLPS
jgi:hypothetical protein